MPVSKAQQKAVTRYMKQNYDEIKVRVSKGQKDVIQAHAAARGESVNGFIGRAITETMDRDNSGAEAAQKPVEGTDSGGATPIPSGTETPSEGVEKTVQGE